MRSLVLALAAGLTCMSVAGAASADRPDSLRWKARPVIVLSDTRDDPRVVRQVAALDRARAALAVRDVEVLREARPDSALRRRLGVAKHGFALVLVGKDGSVKQIWTDPVDPKRIVTIIDRMPMRQHEMRQHEMRQHEMLEKDMRG